MSRRLLWIIVALVALAFVISLVQLGLALTGHEVTSGPTYR